jgi:hypothetical protein
MVTELCAGHRMGRKTAFLFGSFSSSHKFLWFAAFLNFAAAAETSFEACRLFPVSEGVD